METVSDRAETSNILKTRDDPEPVNLLPTEEGGSGPRFTIGTGAKVAWAKSGEVFGADKLRPRIEPWLTALCQSEHLSILLGTGLSIAVHRLATGRIPTFLSTADFGSMSELIRTESDRSAELAGRGVGNIEDHIRVANELLRGLQILAPSDNTAREKASELGGRLPAVMSDFAGGVLSAERAIATAEPGLREGAFNHLVSFLMSFASRTGTRDRLQIFTTNYDRVVEAGAEVAGLHLLDRFVGSLAPVFRASRLDLDMHYNPPGIRGEPRYLEGVVRFSKLHGSLDWVDCSGTIKRVGLPFGARKLESFLDAPGTPNADARSLMIYPNAAKDRETADHPYVELFRDFAASVCRPNHTLIVFGHSLGDEHIVRVIEDMLTIPSTHLVVMSYDDPLGRILRFYERVGRHAQVSLMIGGHVGDFQTLVDHYLPKPAIDKTTFRMAELLRARWGAGQDASEEAPTAAAPAVPDRQ